MGREGRAVAAIRDSRAGRVRDSGGSMSPWVFRRGGVVGMRGRICRAMRAFSRVNEGLMLLMWWVYFPRCVVISM